jgi:hypothetical protein
MDTHEDEWLLAKDKDGQEMLIHNPKYWEREKRFQEGYGEYWVLVRKPPRKISEVVKKSSELFSNDNLQELF